MALQSEKFSRRHQTNAAHQERSADYQANRGRRGRQMRALLRAEASVPHYEAARAARLVTIANTKRNLGLS